MKKYKVTLTTEERQELQVLIAAGKAAAKKLTHARILLKADAADGGPGWPDDRIAEALDISADTIGRVRQRFVEQGLEAALVRKKQDRPSRERKLDGDGEARLIALACSEPPPGTQRLDPATAGRQTGGTARRGLDLRRDRAAGAKSLFNNWWFL